MGQPEGSSIRASDRDRNRVADELRVHCLEGRITVEELEQRLEKAMSAVTINDLAQVTYDLPKLPAPTEAQAQARQADSGARVPGNRPFTRRFIVPASTERTRTLALETIAPALNGYSYVLTRQSAVGLEFERTRLPGWAVGLAVFLFPFGLLALRARNTERIVIALEEHGSRQTAMIIHGTASRRVRKAFADLTF